MEHTDINQNSDLFQLYFKQARQAPKSPSFLGIISLIHLITHSYRLFTLVSFQSTADSLLPSAVSTALIVFLAVHVLLVLISYFKPQFPTILNSTAIILDSLQLVLLEAILSPIFNKASSGELIGSIAVLLIYLISVIGWRSKCYYPFYDNSEPLSMSCGLPPLRLFFYSLITHVAYKAAVSSSTKAVVFVTLSLGLLMFSQSSKAFCNLKVRVFWQLFHVYLVWVSLITFITPILAGVSVFDQNFNLNAKASIKANSSFTVKIFWYLWAYTTPCIIAIVYWKNPKPSEPWYALLIKEQAYKDQTIIYARISEFCLAIRNLSKSQLGSQDTQFAQLCHHIGTHNSFCVKSDCPLQSVELVGRDGSSLEPKKFSKALGACYEFVRCVLELIKADDPTSLKDMIQIAHYELQLSQNRQPAILLYAKYAQKCQNYSEQYALESLKKLTQGSVLSSETISKSTIDAQLAEFRHNIEVSATTLAEFWYLLTDPKCDQKKLYEIANVLFPLKISVDNDWLRIERWKDTESYLLYAKYLIKMFNDVEKGMQILEAVKRIEMEHHNKEQIEVGFETQGTPQAEEQGIIFLQCDGKFPGAMYQVNLAVQRLFGYNKGELLNRKVNDLIPKLISCRHDQILQNYVQSGKATMMNKQRFVWGRCKQGFLFPITILIKPVRNMITQSADVYASCKREVWTKDWGFMFLALDNSVSEITSSLLSLFPQMWGRQSSKKKTVVTDLIPEYFDLIKNKNTQLSSVVQMSRTIKIGKKFYDQESNWIVESQPLIISSFGHIATIVKLIRQFSAPRAISQNKFKGLETSMKDTKMPFQFTLALSKGRSPTYWGGLSSLPSIIYSPNIFEAAAVSSKTVNQAVARNYGAGIRTKRLQDGGIRQIHQVSEPSEEANGNEAENLSQTANVFDNLKPSELSTILEKKTSRKHITTPLALTAIVLVLSSAAAVSQYLLEESFRKQLVGNLEAVRQYSQLGAEVMYLAHLVTQNGPIPPPENREGLKQLVEQLQIYVTRYSFPTMTVIMYSGKSTQSMLLSFALQKYLAETSTLLSGNPQAESHFYITYNSVNNISISLSSEQQGLTSNISTQMKFQTTLTIVFLACSLAIFACLLGTKIWMIQTIVNKKAEILQIFFQIPRKTCNQIQKECERFIQRLTETQESSMGSIQEESAPLIETAQPIKKQRRKKKKVDGDKNIRLYVLILLGFLIYLCFYSFFSFLSFKAAQNSFKNISEAIGTICGFQRQLAEAITAKVILSINSQQFHTAHSTYPLLNSAQSATSLNRLLETLRISQEKSTFTLIELVTMLPEEYSQELNNDYYARNCTIPYCSLAGLQHSLTSSQVSPSSASPQLLQLWSFRSLWRKLTLKAVTISGDSIRSSSQILFWGMVVLTTCNLTLVMALWVRFYRSLQQKITATQYILTFIPLDTINDNPKIAHYIKRQLFGKK